MPHSSSGASTQGRALLQGGHCHLLFGKPTSGSSSAKSGFAQELHGWTRKSQRYFQTLSITKNISKFGAKVCLAVMVRPAQAPFPTASFLPLRSGSRTEDPSSSSRSAAPFQTSHTNKVMEKNKGSVLPLQVAQRQSNLYSVEANLMPSFLGDFSLFSERG